MNRHELNEWNGLTHISGQEYFRLQMEKIDGVTEYAQFEIIDNSNCVFDVKKIDQRLIELGALEDIECEIIEPDNPDDIPFDKMGFGK